MTRVRAGRLLQLTAVMNQGRRPSQPQAAAARIVVFACAASAGIHAGIVPEHLREEPRLGVAFILTVLVLLATATAVVFSPSARAGWISALVLGALPVAYLASRTTGIPLLAPDPEAVDALGVAAGSIELLGLICALRLAQPIARRTRRSLLEEVPR
jgi:hypothetical protein